jgi:four helix bundle protein
MGKQLLRCGTSVAANYRAVCRSRSKDEFIARMGIVAEEADEAFCGSNFWRKQVFSGISGLRIF